MSRAVRPPPCPWLQHPALCNWREWAKIGVLQPYLVEFSIQKRNNVTATREPTFEGYASWQILLPPCLKHHEKADQQSSINWIDSHTGGYVR
jgi:hypothetical protein